LRLGERTSGASGGQGGTQEEKEEEGQATAAAEGESSFQEWDGVEGRDDGDGSGTWWEALGRKKADLGLGEQTKNRSREAAANQCK
jgi:hypothetical protein